jgi:hypothetical protein
LRSNSAGHSGGHVGPAGLLTRRRLVELGTSGYLGLNLGGLWRAQTLARAGGTAYESPRPPIKACILVFLYGGPSHIDTFDPKPLAPADVRGEFATIETSVPGLRISEHLPHMAQVMHHVGLVRSMSHAARLHDSGSIHMLTGRPLEGPDRELFAPTPQYFPAYGAAVAAVQASAGREPRQASRTNHVPFAALPHVFHNVVPTPCQGGGFLGTEWDPLQIDVDPARRAYVIDSLEPREGLITARVASRRTLLGQLEQGVVRTDALAGYYERAVSLLSSSQLVEAIDLTREPESVRRRYGFGATAAIRGEVNGGGGEMGFAREMRGQNFLLARRLVEAGVPFVNVYDFKQQGQNWDAHVNCASQHKQHLLPQFDLGLSGLILDLEERGLLDSTLVVVTGEFGRTPRINSSAGRDHWPDCSTVLLAGGGVTGGAVYGASDRLGEYPALNPCGPADLAATIYDRFGIDPQTEMHDQTQRPYPLAAGQPIRSLFGA